MNQQYDVIVYGATPGGIGAAVAAARRGRRTALLEPAARIGGMMTSGLGRTDIDWLEAAGAIYREFAGKVLQYYTDRYGADSQQVEDCKGGMFFEPSVALKLLWEILGAEPLIKVYCHTALEEATVRDGRLRMLRTSALAEGGVAAEWEAEAFIDGTYEGDLAAAAGVPYWLGRESRDVWNEEYAGKLYMDFHPSKEVMPGSTGEGDERIQAYNYRLCLTRDAANRVPVRRPDDYRREDYVSLIADVEEGRVASIRQVLNILPVPNGKTDANNHHYCMCSSDLPEENGTYLEGDRQERERVVARHRSYLQGLLWFLQQDEALPETFRAEASEWGYAADEFPDSDHFPPQLYVREGRRIQGEYVFTENDARLAPGLGRSPLHYDSVAVGAYPIDSHAVRKREPEGRDLALDGFFGLRWITRIYQIPYGVMVPLGVDGLLVPVAVSATHMGLGTIRMEPCWMQLGYAAGVAADLALEADLPEREVDIDRLQDELLEQRQLIMFFEDVDPLSPAGRAIQYLGTKGAFTTEHAIPQAPITVAEAARLTALARQLTGGRRLPALPASARVLPAGVDMGPCIPTAEPLPEDYWSAHPLLTGEMLRRWQLAARQALGLDEQDGGGTDAQTAAQTAAGHETGDEANDRVSVGEFCTVLYTLLKQSREA
ncbi:FAD-dependent oxidoreductase [Paenibacillus sp. IB182496]|uniref:FAD-dependent oxidoreductase n=1 Tax=Paenibacillus sabuli TaxID=2772509 RepID=A0A927C083_9BACL|nr:FAD-dependent oxidoreductase [Paenibacillus sabuli]MBD2848604.1 FAD-dependent oxidoreductase [Paenibacillus sabuli]